MTHRMQQLALPVEGQHEPAWPSYEAMNEEALRAADVALGRDVEQIALDCGLSRRELNKQRERTPDDDQGGPASLGRQCLYRLALYLDTVRRRYGAERCKPAARLVAKACGVEVADRVAGRSGANSPSGIFRISIEANRELGDYLQKLEQFAANGLDRTERERLVVELDEVLERVQGAKSALLATTTATPLTFGHKAV